RRARARTWSGSCATSLRPAGLAGEERIAGEPPGEVGARALQSRADRGLGAVHDRGDARGRELLEVREDDDEPMLGAEAIEVMMEASRSLPLDEEHGVGLD